MLITKIDVARLTGVSHMTVTRVMHDSPLVVAATRKKVLAACRRLNYRPNLIARSLRMHKSHVLGVIVPTLRHSYYARLISAIEADLKKLGYHILVTQVKDMDLSSDHFSFLAGQRVEGIFVFAGLRDRSVFDYLRSTNIPVVFLDNPGQKGTVFIGTDDYQGALNATNHLLDLGHKRIAHLAGKADVYTAQQRLAGYLAALKAHGIKSRKEDIIFTNYGLDGGYQAAEKLFQSGKKYTSVFCANDYIAVGLLSWAYNHGIKVPEQISVIGFTGDEIGAYSTPPLTTMVQHTDTIGAEAVKHILALIEDRSMSSRILVKPELLIRMSTAKVKSTKK